MNNLNKKIEILNDELNNKDNIIKDLKNKIMMRNNGKIKEFNGLGENNEDININQDIKLNQKNDSDKKRENNTNINSYNINNINKEIIPYEEKKNNTNNKINMESDNDKPLNTEIERLDKEIFNLKSKLKKIIQK